MRAAILFSATLLLPLLAEAAGAPRTFSELVRMMVSLIGAATGSLVLLAIVIYVWGITRDFQKLQEGKFDDLKQYYFWGIAIIFMMVSIWGILNVLRATVFSGDMPQGGSSSSESLCDQFGKCAPR